LTREAYQKEKRKDFYYGIKVFLFVFVAVPLYAVAVWFILNFIEEALR
jgi:hypothetical protein